MGTPDFAVPSLQALLDGGHAVVGVVTQPDKPSGRGGKLVPGPVKALALQHGLPVLQPRRVRRPEAVAEIRALAPDLTVTAAFGQILSQEVLDIPPLGSINVHASLLPRWRGAAPIHRSVMAGDRETGITLMYMDAGMDTGDIILQRAIEVGPAETAGSVSDRLALIGAELLLETVRLIGQGTAPRRSQDSGRATYAAKLEKQDEWIDWSQGTAAVCNRIRGLHPWPVAYTTCRRGILKIWQATPAEGAGAPGTVLALAKNRGPLVATGDGAVLLAVVQPESRGRMAGQAFAAGGGVATGEVLGAVGGPQSPPGSAPGLAGN